MVLNLSNSVSTVFHVYVEHFTRGWTYWKDITLYRIDDKCCYHNIERHDYATLTGLLPDF